MTHNPDGFVVCCDLDGVIWRGDEAIPGAADGVAKMRAAGARVAFVTNNSGSRVGDYLAKLASMSIEAEGVDIVTSAQAAAELLRGDMALGASVLACAGPGVVEALERNGFFIVDEAPADAVVVGWHRNFDFDELQRASDAIRAGARYIATNLDATYPAAHGLLPGAGAIAAAVTTAAGVEPEVAGKPHAATVNLVHERFGARGVMVGDRPSTDGALASALGWPFALVLSGVAGAKGGESVPVPAPPYVADDFGALAPMLIDAFC